MFQNFVLQKALGDISGFSIARDPPYGGWPS